MTQERILPGDVMAATPDQVELAVSDPDELLAQLRQAATVGGSPLAIRLPSGQIVVGRPTVRLDLPR